MEARQDPDAARNCLTQFANADWGRPTEETSIANDSIVRTPHHGKKLIGAYDGFVVIGYVHELRKAGDTLLTIMDPRIMTETDAILDRRLTWHIPIEAHASA